MSIGGFVAFLLLWHCSILYSQTFPHPMHPSQYFKERFKHHTAISEQIVDTSDTSGRFKLLGRWARGPCLAVCARDNYAYIGDGPTFQVLDVSNPAEPKIVAQLYTTGYVIEDMSLYGSHAYLVNWAGLVIIDITVPQAPRQVAYLAIYGSATKVTVADSFAYVTTESGTLVVVDISNPYYPVWRGQTSTVVSEFLHALATKDRYVYVGSEEGMGLAVINATNPENPIVDTFLVFQPFVWAVHRAFVRDTLLFVTVSSDTESLVLFSVSNARRPVFLGKTGVAQVGQSDGSNVISDVTSDGSYAYVTTWGSGVYSIDVSNPLAPSLRGHVLPSSSLFYGGPAIAVSNGQVFAAYGKALWVVDATMPEQLSELAYFPTGGVVTRVAVKGNFAYLASDVAGIWILDISYVSKPRGVANINVGSAATDVIVDGNYLYFVNWRGGGYYDTSYGLWIADVSDPAHPQILSHYTGIAQAFSHPNRIAKSGNLLFMTDERKATVQPVMEIIDVSNPTQPQRVGLLDGLYDIYEIAVQDSIVFLATTYDLKIIDVANPSMPNEISSLLSYPRGVAVRDSLVYAQADSFYVINIKDSYHPVIVGSTAFSMWNYSSDLKFLGSDYILSAHGSMEAFDISDPYHPTYVTSFSPAYGAAMRGNTVVCASGVFGSSILRFSTLPLSEMTVMAGWNLISVPRNSPAVETPALFPTSVSLAYLYNRRYELAETLRTGIGYWLKFAARETVAIDGYDLTLDTVTVNAGWNMVGALNYPISISAIASVPESIVVSRLFGFDGGYYATDSLRVGKGYWVKTSKAGKLILALSADVSMMKRSAIYAVPLSLFDRLTIRDNTGSQQTLYFGAKVSEGLERAPDRYELPPVPPMGIFDARFSSQLMVELIEEGITHEFHILVSSASYPVTITWDAPLTSLSASLQVGEKEIFLSSSGTISIQYPVSSISLKLRGTVDVPKTLALYQNYPNPFNSSTIIEFDIPRPEHITIEVFNILGQQITTVLNKKVESGKHRIALDALQLPSGVYFYTLKSQSYSITKKMSYIR